MLDIKLKSNKKISLLIAITVTVLCSAGFMALYPTFETKADTHYRDSLSRDEFLSYLYRGNYILYKDIAEKTGETSCSYEELYLSVEEEYARDSDMRIWTF